MSESSSTVPPVNASRLALGSAQWARHYGLANQTGPPDSLEIRRILDLGSAAGIDTIDTASSYGDAELAIGLEPDSAHFRVVTKTARVSAGADVSMSVRSGLHSSLQRLSRSSVHALLVHETDVLFSPVGPQVWRTMEELRDEELVGKVGVSVYSPSELTRLLDNYPIQIVQLPYNAFDRRFERAGLLSRLRTLGVEVHARSAFLQGLLLIDTAQLPPSLARFARHHRAWQCVAACECGSPLAAALRVALQQPLLDRVIVGCETASQLETIVKSCAMAPALSPELLDLGEIDEPDLLEPFRWNPS